MAAGEIYQMTLVYTADAVAWANVFYFKVIDDTGTTDAQGDAMESFENTVAFTQKEATSFQVTQDCILSRRVSPTTSPSRVRVIGEIGTLLVPMLPANQALSIRHRSKPGEKYDNGRIFHSGLTEDMFGEGRLEASKVSLWDDFIEDLTANVVDNGRTYRVQHYAKKINTYKDIENCFVSPIPTRMRTRTKPLCPIS